MRRSTEVNQIPEKCASEASPQIVAFPEWRPYSVTKATLPFIIVLLSYTRICVLGMDSTISSPLTTRMTGISELYSGYFAIHLPRFCLLSVYSFSPAIKPEDPWISERPWSRLSETHVI